MEEAEEVELKEGMPVRNDTGDELGALAGMLIAEDEEEAEFIIVTTSDSVDRLVPFEAVLGVADGAILLDMPAPAMTQFPKVRADADPTEDEIGLAYHVYDEHAMMGPDSDE